MYSTVLFLWIVTLTHCVLAGNICSKPPEVPFATIDVDKKEYQPGEEVTYTCRPGYVHQSGTKKYVCNWSGRWLLNTMKCTPKKCPFPGLLENGKISFTELTFQSTISFSCNPGYILNGARISQCMADGRWSGTPPHCQPVTCPPPQIPEFGVILYHTLKPGNVSVFQDMIRFECLPSFALLGNETAMCTANGNWSNIPECKYVTCPTPTGIENGFINFVVRRTYGYKERVSFGCNGRYVLDGPRESMCEKTSDWSIKPSCKAPCKIPVKKATVLYKGEKVAVQDGLKEGIQHDETISFFCKNKEKDCVYTVPASCIDGNLTVPECFKVLTLQCWIRCDAMPANICLLCRSSPWRTSVQTSLDAFFKKADETPEKPAAKTPEKTPAKSPSKSPTKSPSKGPAKSPQRSPSKSI